MLNSNFDSLILKSIMCFEGEEGKDPNTNPESKTETKTEETKTFTQDQVNELMARDRRKNQEAQKRIVGQLEEYQKVAKLTADEKEALEKQIDELRQQTMSAEELAKQAADKTAKEHATIISQLESEKEQWRNRHDNLVIESAITRASVQHGAVDPDQILAVLRTKQLKMVDVLGDDGKPSGMSVPRVKLPDVNKEGKPIELDLTVEDAVKRMKDLDKYANLFKNSKVGGMGNSGSTKTGKINLIEIAKTDPKRYRQLVKERPELLG